MIDPRRRIPRTDALLAEAPFVAAATRLGPALVKQVIVAAQDRARAGRIEPDQVSADALAHLPATAAGMRAVINATGVVVHTNLGRAPLSAAAIEALTTAAGTVDVELDLATGARGRRGAAVVDALTAATGATDALVVNNGAAAILLAVTGLCGPGTDPDTVVVSRGELVEIGDGFRIPELLTSTGVRLREVGTTNRTHLHDYAAAINAGLGTTDAAVGCVLKVHPSNFRVDGFVAETGLDELAGLGVPVVYDIGSGLLRPDPALPGEPDAATALAAGADLVTCSGDKLLGGPQAGIVLGARARGAELVARLRRHPMARALRVDKLTLAALHATLTGPEPPVTRMRRLSAADLARRTRALAAAVDGEIVESTGRIGGGGAPGVTLPAAAVALPDRLAAALRAGDPAVLARVEHGRCLIDLRCVPADLDDELVAAIRTALVNGEHPCA